MKKTNFILLALMCFTTLTYGQTVEDVIALNIKSKGGKEMINKLNSYEMILEAETPMGNIEMKQLAMDKVGWKQEMQIMGQNTYTLVNQSGVFMFNPMRGAMSPSKLDDEKAKPFATKLDINGELVNYAEKGIGIALEGEEEVNGEKCYILAITMSGGSPKKVYISKTTGHIVQEITVMDGPEGQMEMSMIFSNYKPTKEGFIFPMNINTTLGKATVKSIKVNHIQDKSIFEEKTKK